MAYAFGGSANVISSTATVTLPFTVSLWCNPDSVGATSEVLIALGADTRYQIQTDNTNPGRILARVINGGTNPFASSSNVIATGQWAHIIAQFQTTTSRFVSVNGTTSSSVTSASITPTNEMFIGARKASGVIGAGFVGKIAEVAVWNAGIGQTQFEVLSKGFCPTRILPEHLIFYAPLIRETIDVRGGAALTVSGPTASAHSTRLG